MHPRLAELFGYIDDQTVALQTVYEAVPVDQRAVRPNPDRWSPAEVIAHLALTDRRLGNRFASAFDAAPTTGAEADASPILPTIDVNRVLDRTQRLTAPEATRPTATNPELVWGEFADARRGLKSVLARGDGLALGEISLPHPIFGPLSLYEWIAFVGAHTARHTAQIREG